ncbi:hypothetical protein TNCV_3171711 [Trichonephila clavipes]|nr:hypothetical protein TNCV_3171711 [Trichonephila clavipes]
MRTQIASSALWPASTEFEFRSALTEKCNWVLLFTVHRFGDKQAPTARRRSIRCIADVFHVLLFPCFGRKLLHRRRYMIDNMLAGDVSPRCTPDPCNSLERSRNLSLDRRSSQLVPLLLCVRTQVTGSGNSLTPPYHLNSTLADYGLAISTIAAIRTHPRSSHQFGEQKTEAAP